MQTNNTENQNQNTQVRDEQEGMDFLKTQNEVTVIDIPEQTRAATEAEAEKKKNKYKHVPIYKQFLIGRVYTTAIIAYFSYFVLNIIYNVASNMILGDNEDEETSTNQKLLVEEIRKNPTFFIIYSCIIAPIIEEFIFRSIIFKLINHAGKRVQEKMKVLGIIIRILAFLISSFIFAIGHFSFSFKVLFAELRSFPPYFIMGLIFAFAYNRDNYLLASILTHMINNTIATLIILFAPTDKIGVISLSIKKFIFSGGFF